MYEEDIPLIFDFHFNLGHSKNTIKTYKSVFNKYRDFHNMSLKNLLDEALNEQEMNIPLNQLKIYDRINTFKYDLIENHVGNTITSTLTKIKTFYKYYRVKLPYIPPVNTKIIRHNDFIGYDDLLSKDEIKMGLKIADSHLRNWIMVMVSSGATRVECQQMTNQMLFEGTKDAHKKDNFLDALKYLAHHDNVVCTCKLIRQKTRKPYYTFLNPEAVQQLAQYKLDQRDINLNNPLLRHTYDYIGKKCKYINDFLNLGYAGGYSRFRPHMFRKYHATRLNQGLVHLSMDEIDQLQGRGKNATQESYYKNNPEILKINYVKVMNNISIYNTYTYTIKNGELKIKTIV